MGGSIYLILSSSRRRRNRRYFKPNSPQKLIAIAIFSDGHEEKLFDGEEDRAKLLNKVPDVKVEWIK